MFSRSPPPEPLHQAQSPVGSWRLIAYLILSGVVAWAITTALWPDWLDYYVMPLADTSWMAITYLVLAVLLIRPAARIDLDLRSLVAPIAPAELRWAALTAPALLLTATGLLFVLFLPLSYVWPDFVTFWILDEALAVIWTGTDEYTLIHGGNGYVYANVLMFVAIIVLAPLVEELLFRGLLLRNWCVRFGRAWGIGLSSLLFAVLHVDLLGAFLFSVVVSLAYIWTGRLAVPVAIHVIHNLLAWGIEFAWISASGDPTMSLPEFRSYWWIGAAGLVLGTPYLWAMLRRADAIRRTPSPF